MYNFMAAFIICGAVVLIGEIVAKLTKAWVPSVFVSAVVLLIGYWTVIPKELVTEAHLMPFGNTLAMMLIITHMGTMISLETLLAQWRTVVLCVLGLAGMCGLSYFVCPFFMERELIIAGLPPLTGGIVAATMMQTAAQEAGLTTAAVFAISMYCIQGFAGYPLTAIVLKREGALLLEKYRSSKTHAANGPMLDVTKLPDEQTHGILHLPESWNSPVVMLMKLGIVTWLAMLLGGWTGISGAIWCLVLGVVFCRLGFLEPNILTKANSYQIMLFALMMFIFDGLKACTPEMLVSIIVPMIVLIVVGVLGMFIVAYFVARALKISIWLGFGNCLTALYGFPFNAIITESMCKEMAATEDEREYLMAHMFPSMIVGGFSTVTITSVIIAGLFVNLL